VIVATYTPELLLRTLISDLLPPFR
jgi:hypothetical protein